MTHSPSSSGTRIPAAVQSVIAFALATGVLLFGAVVYFMQRQGTWTPMAPDRTQGMRVVAMLTCLAGAAVLYLLRRRTATRSAVARYAHINLIGWSIGELTALVGGVYFFMSGDPTWYFLGLIVFVGAVLLFPIRGNRERNE